MQKIVWIALILLVISLVDPLLQFRKLTNSTTLEDQLNAIDEFARNNKFGESGDFWLAKKSAFGGLDKVALIFGVIDDEEMCQELADMYVSKYPASQYHCISANE